MKLNEPQERAVRTTNGKVLVLAGAGSGKTRVIVHRIAHLIDDKRIPPQSILGLTFTNKAAEEMRHRLRSLIGKKAEEVVLSTFHSFCMRVLRKEIERLGYTRQFSLYDERDIERLIKQLSQEMLGHDGELPSLGPTKAALMERSYGVDIEEEGNWHDGFSKDLYDRLSTCLRAYNAVSFDSLITLTIQLFQEHPDVLARYQELYQYLMIDEYQDTNPAQFRLAELLAKKWQNLCVVGDDDQSIYGWRGAEVKNILQFPAEHIIKLEQNYRSTSFILDAANAVIAHNKNRYAKKLWSARTQGTPIEIFHAPTDVDEANAVVQRLIRMKKEGHSWKEMAILYRSNALSRPLEMALLQASWQGADGQWRRSIPYEVFGGLEFSERSEIKDLLAYLRVIANPLDQEALLRIINVPRRGISDQYLDQITQKNRLAEIPLWHVLQQEEKKQTKAFVALMKEAQERFSSFSFGSALEWLVDKIHYKKAIEEEVKSEKMRAFKWENVQEFIRTLSDTKEETLQDFVSHTTLYKQQMGSTKKEGVDRVHLMTFHSAKGLEFPICFLVGLEQGILPHEKSLKETGIEEERRLFYVALTRAQTFLTLSMACCRTKMGKPTPTAPSPFLYEIPKSLYQTTDYKIFI